MHDSVRLHVATMATICCSDFDGKSWNIPLCSQYHSPRSYHVFGLLGEALKGRRFRNNNGVQRPKNAQPGKFSPQGIHNLVDRWDTCFNIHATMSSCYFPYV